MIEKGRLLMENIIEMNQICMSFNSNKVLNNVDFTLRKGEVNSLIGANGAGKSTLIKILNGIHKPISGEIFIDSQLADIKNPSDVEKYGISFVHQELNLCQDLTIAENMFIGNWQKDRFGQYDKKKTEKKASELLKKMGISLDPSKNVRKLRTAEKQIVEILKALTRDIEVIVLDEPTSSLNETEKKYFFELISNLQNEGISIIFITHFLDDVIQISDRVTVIKDGENNGIFEKDHYTKNDLIKAMIGDNMKDFSRDTEYIENKKIVLELKNLTRKKVFKDISFKVHEGEIIGICGLLGAGKTEIARSIYGLDSFDDGQVMLNGAKEKSLKPSNALENGISFLPEDRKTEGFIPLMSVTENVTLSIKKQFKSHFFSLDFKLMQEFTNRIAQSFSVKMVDSNQTVVSLSGGNQQKVVIARCLSTTPKVFLLDEPTRGVDVNAKNEIYSSLQVASRRGTSIVMFSSEIDELYNNCHQIVTLKQGKITSIVKTNEVTKNQLLDLIS